MVAVTCPLPADHCLFRCAQAFCAITMPATTTELFNTIGTQPKYDGSRRTSNSWLAQGNQNTDLADRASQKAVLDTGAPSKWLDPSEKSHRNEAMLRAT